MATARRQPARRHGRVVCGGDCAADADADGICDDVDDCVGALDAWWRNGPGAIYECGCSDIRTACDRALHLQRSWRHLRVRMF